MEDNDDGYSDDFDSEPSSEKYYEDFEEDVEEIDKESPVHQTQISADDFHHLDECTINSPAIEPNENGSLKSTQAMNDHTSHPISDTIRLDKFYEEKFAKLKRSQRTLQTSQLPNILLPKRLLELAMGLRNTKVQPKRILPPYTRHQIPSALVDRVRIKTILQNMENDVTFEPASAFPKRSLDPFILRHCGRLEDQKWGRELEKLEANRLHDHDVLQWIAGHMELYRKAYM